MKKPLNSFLGGPKDRCWLQGSGSYHFGHFNSSIFLIDGNPLILRERTQHADERYESPYNIVYQFNKFHVYEVTYDSTFRLFIIIVIVFVGQISNFTVGPT